MLWTLHDIQKALSLTVKGENLNIDGISIDTRTLKKGDLFVALKAERDGHDFIDVAIKKGGSACLVSQGSGNLVVKNTLNALTDLAKNRVVNHTGKRIAITGSSGKTSLTHMLATVCGAHKPEKSYNNHWGVPLTLARMPVSSSTAVIELGTNHVGEIKPLSILANPDVVVITNIAPAHIGNFENLDELADEKFSIQQGLSTNGYLILPEDLYVKYSNKIIAKKLTFGLNSTADIHLVSNGNNILKIMTPAGVVTTELFMIGKHHILNALATIAVLYSLNLPMKLLNNMNKVTELDGRGKIHKIAGITIIDDSFNANPLSMEIALNNLQNHKNKGRKIAILGDMLELGESAVKYHENLFQQIASTDKIISVGKNMKSLHKILPLDVSLGHYESIKDIDITKIISQFKNGDIILVKGSKGVFWTYGFVEKLIAELKLLNQKKS